MLGAGVYAAVPSEAQTELSQLDSYRPLRPEANRMAHRPRAIRQSLQRDAARLAPAAGLRVTLAVDRLGDIAGLALADDGVLYSSDYRSGRIYALQDRQQDGQIDQRRPLALSFDGPSGLAVYGEVLYVVDHAALWSINLNTGMRKRLASLVNVPAKKTKRPLIISPDGTYLYLGFNLATGGQIVKIHSQSGTALESIPLSRAVLSLAQTSYGAVWAGLDNGLISITHPEKIYPLEPGAAAQAILLPETANIPQTLARYMAHHILVAQSRSLSAPPHLTRGNNLILIPANFGAPAQHMKLMLGGFVNNRGTQAWGRPSALLLDARGLFMADNWGGVLWRLSPSVTPDPKPALDDITQPQDTPQINGVNDKAPEYTGFGSRIVQGSQIDNTSIIEGSTISRDYEKNRLIKPNLPTQSSNDDAADDGTSSDDIGSQGAL